MPDEPWEEPDPAEMERLRKMTPGQRLELGFRLMQEAAERPTKHP